MCTQDLLHTTIPFTNITFLMSCGCSGSYMASETSTLAVHRFNCVKLLLKQQSFSMAQYTHSKMNQSKANCCDVKEFSKLNTLVQYIAKVVIKL